MTNRFKPDYQGAEHKGRITSVSNSALSYMQAPWWSYSDLNSAEICITWMENACSLYFLSNSDLTLATGHLYHVHFPIHVNSIALWQ